MRRLVAVGAVLAAVIVGCKENLPTKAPGQAVTVRGEIVAGTECPLLVTKDAHRFSLAGDVGRFKPGDRVCVQGTVAEVSFCMAGEATISVTAIASEDSCP